ncbi:MAG: OsmC family protein [Candidatus Bathyarchaeia archaeon]|jgi:uncharacterized OsmC-like protein
MSESEVTTLNLIEGYKFRVDFGAAGVPSLVVDESVPIGAGAGPSPILLLSAAVGHCLSSSLLFCLQKARIKVNDLKTTVVANKARNQEGRLRVANIEVKVQLSINEEDKTRVQRCLDIFENYCTVTQSVMQGIKVNVDITKV